MIKKSAPSRSSKRLGKFRALRPRRPSFARAESNFLRVLVHDVEQAARDWESDQKLPKEKRNPGRASGRGAALSLLGRFAEAVEAGDPVAPEILGYFKRAIERYLADDIRSMDAALGLGRPAHRVGGRQADRDIAIALRVRQLASNFPLLVAKETAAREFSVEMRTVERALKNAMLELERLFPLEIDSLKG